MQPTSDKRLNWNDEKLEQFHRLYALRSQIAGFAAHRAAERIADGASYAPLQKAYRDMHSAAQRNDYADFLEADMSFHRTVMELAKTPLLVDIWLMIENESREFISWVYGALHRDLTMIANHHQNEFDSIVDGNPRFAEHSAQVNLDSIWQILMSQPAETSEEPDPIERVCAYVLLHLHHKLSLQTLARDVAHLSASHFAKLFRDRRGESFRDYVQGLRLRRADALLGSTDLPVHEVAGRVGYGDVSRFAAHFRRMYGCSPSEWREKVQKRPGRGNRFRIEGKSKSLFK